MAATTELLHYRLEAITSDTLVVIVSQPCASGEMLGLCRSISKDITVLAVTNELESELAQRGNEVMLLARGYSYATAQARRWELQYPKTRELW